MAFNTGNAVGSTDPRDLSDNAENLDRFANGTNTAYDDRLGVSRKSLAGMESDFATDQSERATTFANFLASSGYVGTGTGGAIENYAGGIEITEYNQLIRESGEFYRAKASLSLPYTTTGTWVGDDETRFVSVGDAALRQEIGSGIFRADSLANLESTPGRFDGDAARLVSGTGRDGDFRWDSSDLSATLVVASATSDSVDDTTDTINDADHPFSDGDGVITQTTVNGLTAQTVYWVVNSTSGSYQLSATFGGGAVDLTGTTNVTIDKLLDPLQGVYVTPTADKTGASGAWARRLGKAVNALWFGALGDGSSDNTPALQKWLDFSANRSQILPHGVYNHTGLSLDPSKSYNIIGEVYDPDAIGGTALVNTNSSGGHAISVDNTPFTGNFDNQIRLTNLTIKGNASSGDGINCDQTMIFLENVWITGNGRHGMFAQRCYSSAFRQVSFSNNTQHGFVGIRALNAVHFDHCLFNGNAAVTGFAGCQLTGAAGADRNFGVTFTSCDFTGNGAALGGGDTAFGLVVQQSSGVNVIGCYGESNFSHNLFADNTASGLNIIGGFWQDSEVFLSRVNGLTFIGNELFDSGGATTTLNIDGGLPDVRATHVIDGTTYTGTVNKIFAGGASDASQFIYTGPPTSGSWEKGDFIRNSDANGGDTYGWICTVSGTPGTWLPINQIPQVFANHGDADATLAPLASFPSNYWRSPLTANRSVTLSTSNAFSGCKFRVVRSAGATGSFDLSVGGLKILTAGQWCDVEYDGSAWVLSAFGSL